MQAIILAAGYATRLGHLTENMPKPLLPIGERPIINHIMDGIATISTIKKVHIITNHKFYNHFMKWANETEEKGTYPNNQLIVWDDGTSTASDRLGAIGDILFTIKNAAIDEDIMIVAGDNLYTFKLKDYYDFYMSHGCDSLCAARLTDMETLKGFAVATIDDTNTVTSLVEKPKIPPSDIGVYAIYIYRKDTLPLIDQYLQEGNNPDAPGYFPSWLYKKKPVKVYLFDGEVLDIGTIESYHEACERFGNKLV